MTREETINFLRKKLEKNPKSILFARLADFYLKQKRIKEALELCTRGIENNPDYITGDYILAKIYLTMGDHEKAETQFKKVISHDRYFLSAHKHLGDMMAKIGWENKAINHYKDILQLDPLEQEAAQMLETFSIEESTDESAFSEEAFPTNEDIPEPEEQPEEKGMESSAIDQELRKVFDEENISEKTSAKNIELEEVTTQDDTAEEESKSSEIEELEFQLPDDDSEIISAEKPPETKKQKEAKESPESVSEEESSDDWMLPDELAEETSRKQKEPEEGQETKSSGQDKMEEPSQEEMYTLSEDTLSEKNIPSEKQEDFESIVEEPETEFETESNSQELTESPLEIPESEPEQSEFLLEEEEEDETESLPEEQEKLTEESEESLVTSDQTLSTQDISDQQEQGKREAKEEVEKKEEPKEPEVEEVEEPEQPTTDSPEQEEKTKRETSPPEDTLITPTLGEIYTAQGQYSKALDVYKKLLEKNPDNKEYAKKIKELEEKT